MEIIVKDWTIERLCKEKNNITTPEYQREPHLWNIKEKSDLIDSVLKGLDIPKIYFYKIPKENNKYEVVDGQQRLEALWGFCNNEFPLSGKKFHELGNPEQRKIKEYELQVTEIVKAEDSELRLLFLRLQLGELLVAGEKLKAQTGIAKDFVFQKMVKCKFIREIHIPERRFAKQTLCAQICINSYWKEKYNTFCRTRYIDLEDFFKKCNDFRGDDLKFIKGKFDHILLIIDILEKYFRGKTNIFTNRSFILSLYLFVEELINDKKEDKMKDCVKFVDYLLKEIRAEKKLKFNRTKEEFYIFESYLNNAPGEKYQIENRHNKLKEFFEEFIQTGKIKGKPKTTS